MSETQESMPVAETQQPVAEQRDYAAEVEMLKAQNHRSAPCAAVLLPPQLSVFPCFGDPA